jgi:hypothetical protein
MASPWDADAAASSCAQIGTLLDQCTAEEQRALLVGRWWECSGSWLGYTSPFPAGIVGAEFVRDGSFYALALSSDGQVVRSSRADLVLQWALVERISSPGEPCLWQLNLTDPSGSFTISSPQFYEQPRQMLLNTGGDGAWPRFVAIP